MFLFIRAHLFYVCTPIPTPWKRRAFLEFQVKHLLAGEHQSVADFRVVCAWEYTGKLLCPARETYKVSSLLREVAGWLKCCFGDECIPKKLHQIHLLCHTKVSGIILNDIFKILLTSTYVRINKSNNKKLMCVYKITCIYFIFILLFTYIQLVIYKWINYI